MPASNATPCTDIGGTVCDGKGDALEALTVNCPAPVPELHDERDGRARRH
jgi:hypothetical protein